MSEFILFLNSNENKFLNDFYERGIVRIENLTNDNKFIECLRSHPLLKWKQSQIDVKK